jgi:serine/threonine protein kinase/tetratricopeptide (TPR) repeat protein
MQRRGASNDDRGRRRESRVARPCGGGCQCSGQIGAIGRSSTDNGPVNPGETISHYRILDRLGSGGMGDVYRAEDLRLHRLVALKMLRDAATATPEAATAPASALAPGETAVPSLLAEARAASALTHPNIAVIYDAGTVEREGHPLGFIAMELVEGTTVAALLGNGPLDLDRALDIVEPIADALADAHAKGLVHRDIKPSNVMVTPAGRVKLLDFGVAQRRAGRLIAPDDPTRTGDVSDAAGFVGTLPYVAPEQATRREVDGRADIFSLGVMLYELVCGTLPFTGENAAQMLEAILRDDVPPFPAPLDPATPVDRRDRPDQSGRTDRTSDAIDATDQIDAIDPAPDRPRVAADPRLAPLERLVRAMLARDPDRRIATARDVVVALAAIRTGDRPPATIDRDRDRGDDDDLKRVAIAGFANISGNAEDDWLGTGIAETLTADVGQLEGVVVIPRERISELVKTVAQQTGERGDSLWLRAGRELRARWIVFGGFQRSGDMVRVTASLTDVASGQLVRTAKVDGGLHAIFDLQDQLVRELAEALRAAVTPQTHASAETAVVEAYEALSRGILNRSAETHESLDRAGWLFERAVALDPTYARAHLELGATYGQRADYLALPELRLRAVASLRRAIDLHADSPRAWRELGAVLVAMGQTTEGVAAIRRALALDPQDPSSHGVMGRALFTGLARFRDAVASFETALERNAKAGWYALQLAHCAALLRDFARGERAAQQAMALQEAFLSGQEGLFIAGSYMRAGHLAALQGEPARAVGFFEQEVEFLLRADHALRARILVELNARLGGAYLALGETRKAQAAFAVALDGFERRVRLGADDPFTRYYAASVHALKGDTEPALAFLQRAVSQLPAFTAARARIEPEFEALRSDPRFRRLVGLS